MCINQFLVLFFLSLLSFPSFSSLDLSLGSHSRHLGAGIVRTRPFNIQSHLLVLQQARSRSPALLLFLVVDPGGDAQGQGACIDAGATKAGHGGFVGMGNAVDEDGLLIDDDAHDD